MKTYNFFGWNIFAHIACEAWPIWMKDTLMFGWSFGWDGIGIELFKDAAASMRWMVIQTAFCQTSHDFLELLNRQKVNSYNRKKFFARIAHSDKCKCEWRTKHDCRLRKSRTKKKKEMNVNVKVIKICQSILIRYAVVVQTSYYRTLTLIKNFSSVSAQCHTQNAFECQWSCQHRHWKAHAY